MSLYFVKHEHNPETCPAQNPEAGAMLLSHLSPGNARQYGIDIHGDAVLDGKHTFVLILDAAEKQHVEDFMAPFKQAGSVEIWPASSCERVVERSSC